MDRIGGSLDREGTGEYRGHERSLRLWQTGKLVKPREGATWADDEDSPVSMWPGSEAQGLGGNQTVVCLLDLPLY
jgi:hypothetical protein